MTQRAHPTLALIAVAALSGCASANGRYPSLEIRPGERASGTFMPVASAPTPTPPPVAGADLIAHLAQLEATATAAHASFLAAAPSAKAAADAAAGAEIESNAWAAAQVALADLDSQRSIAATSLGDLDLLYADATLEARARDEIDAARAKVLALLRDEDQKLAELRAEVR